MLNKLEYEIINECKCGPEEFFVKQKGRYNQKINVRCILQDGYGELADIAVDKYSTTTKKIYPSYSIHSKPNGSGSNENNNQKEEKKNSRDDTNENNELVPLPAHDTTSKYTATMRDLLGIKD